MARTETAMGGGGSTPRDRCQEPSRSGRRTRGTHVRAAAVADLSDQELLEGLRCGSEPHFNELYNRYFQRIHHFTFHRIRNHADAEEIVQETFTVVFRNVESYRGQSSLLSWIYGIAKNTVNNHLRRMRNQEQKMELVEPEWVHTPGSFASCTPEEQLHLRRCADAISDRLQAVSSWQAEIFLMRHVEDLSIGEISERTDRSSDAIRSSLYRVKRMLVEAAEPVASRAT